MSIVSLSIQIPTLPEGWEGNPDDLLQFFGDNAVYELEGEFPTGQIGGARPTEDVGIWYGDDSIEKFVDGVYRPISDVPVGSVFPWAGISPTAPANYVFCDGSSISREDYQALFLVVGTTWGGDDTPTHFKVPDLRGRIPYGSGTGDYAPQDITGRMKTLATGSYFGKEWINREDIGVDQPTGIMKNVTDAAIKAAEGGRFLSVQSPGIAIQYIIRYR